MFGSDIGRYNSTRNPIFRWLGGSSKFGSDQVTITETNNIEIDTGGFQYGANALVSNRSTVDPACSFQASLIATKSDVTGDGTEYTIPFDFNSWDFGDSFNTSTNLFTAPSAGIYHLSGQIRLSGVVVAHDSLVLKLLINGSDNRTIIELNPGAIEEQTGTRLTIPFTRDYLLSKGATVALKITVDGGTKVIDIQSGSTSGTILSGFQITR